MYCQACGTPTSQQMRYCNRCGVQLVAPGDNSPVKSAREKRFDEYLDGLFWITFFGIGFVVGGGVILKKLGLSNWLIIGYMVLTGLAFLVNFGLNLWGLSRIVKLEKTGRGLTPSPDTAELPAQQNVAALPPVPSVTENTTRSFDPVYVKRNTE